MTPQGNVPRVLDTASTGEVEQRAMSASFATDIRPLFRDKDVTEMRDVSGLDLASYEQVRDSADAIYEQVESGWMPCDLRWSDQQIALFKRWIDEGFAP